MGRSREEAWDWPPPRRFQPQEVVLEPAQTSGSDRILKVGFGALWVAKWIALLGFGALVGVAVAIVAQVAIIRPAKAAEACLVNYDKFVALKTGMTTEEAASIIGCPGIEVSTAEIAGTRTEMLKWDANKTGFAAATLTFVNGKLMSKMQMGLR